MIGQAVRSELYKLRKRPGAWIIGGVWLALATGFGIVLPYIAYIVIRSTPEAAAGADPEELLTMLLPENLPAATASMYPLFGAAMMLVLGALVGGGEYRWQTWSTTLTQAPTRAAVLTGQWAGLLVVFAGIAVATMLVVGLGGLVVSAIEGRAVVWPPAGDVAAAAGAMLLISAVWGAFGYTLAVLFRSPGTGMAVGLVWALVVENLVTGLSSLLSVLETLQRGMIGLNSGSLVSAIGAPAEAGAPGMTAVNSGPVSIAFLVGYALVFAALALLLIRRRDIA